MAARHRSKRRARFLTEYNKSVITNRMELHKLRSARLDKGWTQTQAAVRLGMTQAYLNFLENGKRRLTPQLVRRTALVYGLSPEVLPIADAFVPAKTNDQRLTLMLAKLGYPGFMVASLQGLVLTICAQK